MQNIDILQSIKEIESKRLYSLGEIRKFLGMKSNSAAKHFMKTKINKKDIAIIGGTPEYPRYGIYGQAIIDYLSSFKK